MSNEQDGDHSRTRSLKQRWDEEDAARDKLQRRAKELFLEEQGKQLPVSYIGTDPLPDTFVDKSQALVEGRPGDDGRFVAEHVQAKCASKYEAAPGGDKPAPAADTQQKSSM